MSTKPKHMPFDGGIGNIAHWSFENYSAKDSSPNHNDGVMNNIRFQMPSLNNSASFNTHNSYITFTDKQSLDMPEQFSWVIWGNWKSNAEGYFPFLWKESIPGDSTYRNKPSYGLWLFQDHIHAGILLENKQWVEVVTDSTFETIGRWHLICVTYDGSKLRIYYDSRLVASNHVKTSASIYDSDQELNIGRMHHDGSWEYFKGLMDEIGFYNVTLTPKQVLSIWESEDGVLPLGNTHKGKIRK